MTSCKLVQYRYLSNYSISQSLAVRDAVRECLEKDPSERTEDDIKVLLEFTQRLRAFSNMTLAVRKAMCQAMVCYFTHYDSGEHCFRFFALQDIIPIILCKLSSVNIILK